MKLIIFNILALFAFCSAVGQESVPAEVADNFRSLYADATDVEWEKEGDLYEVEFELDGNENEVTFDETGTIVSQNVEVPVSEIPVEVKNTLDTQFKDREIDEVKKEERDGQVVYNIELEDFLFDDKVVISSDGEVVK